MRLVARVDALGAVAGVEVLVELQARHALEHRHAVFLGGARVHGRFVDHDVAALEHRANRLAGLDQRRQVRLLVLVDGVGTVTMNTLAWASSARSAGVAELRGPGQFVVLDFQGVIVAGL